MNTDKMCQGLCSVPSSVFEQVAGGGFGRGGGVGGVAASLPEGIQSSRLPLKGGLYGPWIYIHIYVSFHGFKTVLHFMKKLTQ